LFSFCDALLLSHSASLLSFARVWMCVTQHKTDGKGCIELQVLVRVCGCDWVGRQVGIRPQKKRLFCARVRGRGMSTSSKWECVLLSSDFFSLFSHALRVQAPSCGHPTHEKVWRVYTLHIDTESSTIIDSKRRKTKRSVGGTTLRRKAKTIVKARRRDVAQTFSFNDSRTHIYAHTREAGKPTAQHADRSSRCAFKAVTLLSVCLCDSRIW
jgi:hypothetical protein